MVNLSMEDKVREVTFNVSKGEIFGLVGTHRSGVYELVEALAGVHPSTSGHILLHGQPVQIRGVQDASRLKIGYLSDAAESGEETGSIVDGLQPVPEAGEPNLRDEISQLRGVTEVIRRMRISTTNIHATSPPSPAGTGRRFNSPNGSARTVMC